MIQIKRFSGLETFEINFLRNLILVNYKEGTPVQNAVHFILSNVNNVDRAFHI
jgi:hypothetical protein